MLNLTLERIERQIRNLPVEHVYVLGPDHEILFHHTDNKPNLVTFPVSAFAHLEIAVVTHNHPGGRSFSLTDVRVARAADLQHLRVVTHKRRYSLEPPSEGWRAIGHTEFERAVAREELLLRSVLDEEIARRVLTRSMANAVAPHRLWERVAALGLIRYNAEKW
jgi:hypothetical protein